MDVDPIPQWSEDKITKRLIERELAKKDFINSVAINIYHDGSEGLAQHFDDAKRFE